MSKGPNDDGTPCARLVFIYLFILNNQRRDLKLNTQERARGRTKYLSGWKIKSDDRRHGNFFPSPNTINKVTIHLATVEICNGSPLPIDLKKSSLVHLIKTEK
jgi:hypothetical protein